LPSNKKLNENYWFTYQGNDYLLSSGFCKKINNIQDKLCQYIPQNNHFYFRKIKMSLNK